MPEKTPLRTPPPPLPCGDGGGAPLAAAAAAADVWASQVFEVMVVDDVMVDGVVVVVGEVC